MRRWFVCAGGILATTAGLVAANSALCEAATAPSHVIANVDLAKAFHTSSPWRLIATQGPGTVDNADDPAPGAIQLCLRKNVATPCTSQPVPMPPPQSHAWSDEPHYLNISKPVYPMGPSAPPLLLIVTASVYAGDGGQLVITQLLDYSRATDKFLRIYVHARGTNNNEEVRLISVGPLRGDVISAETTGNAPYAYWIEVDTFTRARTYLRVLRYRSATRYGDGNSLAVIDSEMPNIERRLGLWKPGSPLPLPMNTPCPRPRLQRAELWCH